MKWLVADTVYRGFVNSLYAGPAASSRTSDPYDQQLESMLRKLFGASDFYSRYLREAGHEVIDVVLNAVPLQRAWCREHMRWPHPWSGPLKQPGLVRAFEAQVRLHQPDVLLLLDVNWGGSLLLQRLRAMVPLVVGQVAAPVDFARDFSVFDLVMSSLPHFVDRFRSSGVRSELVPLAFEPTVLDAVPHAPTRDISVAFVGSLDENEHSSGTRLLKTAAGQLPLAVWGPRPARRLLNDWLGEHYQGEAWGRDMYAVLARSKIVLNRHIDIAEDNANNLRLFEATGMGACLVTDDKRNLHHLFHPGADVITYASPEQCVAEIRMLLEDGERCARVAQAGHRRTLTSHTYAQRVQVIQDFVATLVPQPVTLWQPRPALVSRAARAAHSIVRPRNDVSAGYRQIASADATPLVTGWKDSRIPSRQRVVVERALAATRAGRPPRVFTIAADAVRQAGLHAPSLLEVGCASGYYNDVLQQLVPGGVRYIGLDYSLPLLLEARRARPHVGVLAGDATCLPLSDGSIDIVLSSAVVMHVPNWGRVVDEAFRVARSAVVLHRTPVVQGPTSFFEKRAYGVAVVELALSEADLLRQCRRYGAKLASTWSVEDLHLPGIDTPVPVKTYLFNVGGES